MNSIELQQDICRRHCSLTTNPLSSHGDMSVSTVIGVFDYTPMIRMGWSPARWAAGGAIEIRYLYYSTDPDTWVETMVIKFEREEHGYIRQANRYE